VATGRSNAGTEAGGSVTGVGSTDLAAIGATATGFGASAISVLCTGRDGTLGAASRGATTGIDFSVAISVEGILNTVIDRSRSVEDFSEARVGTTPSRTPAIVACTTTLSHSPVVERGRVRARVLNRASLNRSDICPTELKG
jgi:hypothetical protein